MTSSRRLIGGIALAALISTTAFAGAASARTDDVPVQNDFGTTSVNDGTSFEGKMLPGHRISNLDLSRGYGVSLVNGVFVIREL